MRRQAIKTIKVTRDFEKSYLALPPTIKKQAYKKDLLFRANAFDPRLHTHKLKGTLKGYWSYSVNYSYRVLFRFTKIDAVLYLDIGTHSIYQ
jgi:mRNA-degrading endonuclease YafQ of YafQ-DinJ toxin-antitoxin module